MYGCPFLAAGPREPHSTVCSGGSCALSHCPSQCWMNLTAQKTWPSLRRRLASCSCVPGYVGSLSCVHPSHHSSGFVVSTGAGRLVRCSLCEKPSAWAPGTLPTWDGTCPRRSQSSRGRWVWRQVSSCWNKFPPQYSSGARNPKQVPLG